MSTSARALSPICSCKVQSSKNGSGKEGGAPAEGPLVFHGPFVMNSVEQIRAAEQAYHSGQMGVLEELLN